VRRYRFSRDGHGPAVFVGEFSGDGVDGGDVELI